MIGPPRIVGTFPGGGGDAGAERVVEVMRRLAREDLATRTPAVQRLYEELALKSTRMGLPGASFVDRYWTQLYDFLAGPHYRFVEDPQDAETVKTPDRQVRELISRGYIEGDCDDRATLAVSLLGRANLPAYLILVSERADHPYHHVFYGSSHERFSPIGQLAVQAGDVIPFDPQEKVPPREWPKWQKRRVFCVF